MKEIFGIWNIVEDQTSDTSEVTIKLDQALFGIGFPRGTEGEERNGLAFYEDRKGISREERYITSRIVFEPVLTSVTSEQYQKWKSLKIFAKKVLFVWHE